ncbi:DNA-binding LacI/PurR family transcriptional regulator [Actinoplanes lutulentus]|uniref:LacI family transcriptional regulator n=1 Tax=Actinoplanes lutulentus TaxID=1287878 RepID=A0A327Z122_9ACTN|nr:LacI family DNA-binding transcriptional regulator [Actinoplanes lutulentus]MBB2947492.1 DNA-binding LacI/PurR family transcriptional regulator [Actinoplanes lutulentus]RAK28098.1 LacI family transcriptional regulator [Actinoplanes lutulentus]
MISRPRQPTMDQVAEVAGVSRATVSRVINNAASVAPSIREAVQRAITATGYVPNVAARSLVTRRSNSVALVISEPDRPDDHSFLNRIFTDPYFGRVTAGATGALRPHDVHLVVVPTDAADQHQVIRYLRQGHVDGVLLISSNEHDPLPAQVHALGIPAVLSSRPSGPLPVSYVDVDQRAGAALAAAHLLSRGCRELATINGPLDIPAGQERLDGFRSYLGQSSALSIASNALPRHVPAVTGDFTRAGGEAAARALLEAHPAIDGLFVASDLMAEGALRAVQDRGRRVPQDVAVVGFDDSSVALECRPPLTTVRQPVEEMAAEMAELLMAHIDMPGRSPRSVIFQPTLVLRESA